MVTLAELKLSLFEMGGEWALADYNDDNAGPASPCPLPLHPVAFTFACRGHSITLASSWQLSYLCCLYIPYSDRTVGPIMVYAFLPSSWISAACRHTEENCMQCKNSPFNERLKNTLIYSVTKQSRRGGCYSWKYWETFSVCSFLQCYLMARVRPVWCQEPL